MNKYFNIYIEFDKIMFNSVVESTLTSNDKGYICIIDGNVLAYATRNEFYRNIINGALVNSCDGDSIAIIASIIHRKNFSSHSGPSIFDSFIKKKYKHYFLGNTNEVLKLLENKLIRLGYDTNQYKFEPLPFKNVEDFDYTNIANNINEFSPDIIWVSLGAPKQEIFISNILPYINKGLLFGIGAAFNLYLGDKKNRRAPKLMINWHLEWLFRVIQEPKRIGKRAFNYLFILPYLIIKELQQLNVNKIKNL